VAHALHPEHACIAFFLPLRQHKLGKIPKSKSLESKYTRKEILSASASPIYSRERKSWMTYIRINPRMAMQF
jgi:hypothetical protein